MVTVELAFLFMNGQPCLQKSLPGALYLFSEGHLEKLSKCPIYFHVLSRYLMHHVSENLGHLVMK